MTLEELKIVITAETNKAKNEIKGLTNEAKKMQQTLNDNVNTGGLKQINEGAENATKTFKKDTNEIKGEMDDLGGVISAKSNQISKALIELMPSSLTGSFKQIATKIIEVFGGINVGVKATATNVGVKLNNGFKDLNKEIGHTGEVSAASFGLATANIKQLEAELKKAKTRYEDIMDAQEEIFNDDDFVSGLGDADYETMEKEADDAAKAVADAQAKLSAALSKTAQSAGTATTATTEAGTAAAGASGAFAGLAGVLGALGPIILAIGIAIAAITIKIKILVAIIKIYVKVFTAATKITLEFLKTVGLLILKTNLLAIGFNNLKTSLSGLAKKFKSTFIDTPINNFFSDLNNNIYNAIKTNQALGVSLGTLKGAFLTAFTPIINAVIPILNALINVLTRLMMVIANVVSLLFGTSIKGAVNGAKAFDREAKAIGGVSKAAKEATKALMSFDEINKINSDTADDISGGASADWGSINFNNLEDFKFKSIKEALNSLLDYLIAQLPKLESVLNTIAEKVNYFSFQLVKAFGDPEIINKTKYLFTELANICNGFIAKVDFEQIGIALGAGFNLILYAVNSFVREFDWQALGRSLSEGLNGIISTVDWNELGYTMVAGWNITINFLYGAINTFDWAGAGKSLGGMLNSMVASADFKTAGETFSDGVIGILTFARSAIEEFDFTALSKKLVEFVDTVDWVGVGENLGEDVILILDKLGPAINELAPDVLDAIEEMIEGIPAEDVGEALADFFDTVDFELITDKIEEILDTLVVTLGEIFISWIATSIENKITDIESVGEYIVEGIKKGIKATAELAFGPTGSFIYDVLIDPILSKLTGTDGFDINSPSKVMEEDGKYIVQGLVDGLGDTQKLRLIRDNIKKITDTIKTDFKECWDTMNTTTLESLKTVANNIKEKFNNIKETMTTAFSNWQSSVSSSMSSIYNTVSSWVSSVISKLKEMWNNINNANNVKVSTTSNSNVKVTVSGSARASGGIVDTGELFIAREAGPELVGTFGNKTAVANNEQIIEGIKRGVMEAMMSSNSENKETNVNLYLDSQLVAKKVIKYHNDVVKQTGLSPLFV